MKIYLSGPISGLSEETFRSSFDQAGKIAQKCFEKKYEGDKVEIVNPCLVQPCTTYDCNNSRNPYSLSGEYFHDWTCHMRHDIKALMDCHAIVMLPQWQTSKGAQLELHIARQLEMEEFYLHYGHHDAIYTPVGEDISKEYGNEY